MRRSNSGPRSNAWSRSKFTNQTPFDPQMEEVGRAFELFFDEWMTSSETIARQMPAHERFLMPVTVDEISATLARVPARFKQGLEAVILLGGSAKQEKVRTRFFYGRYSLIGVIYLHAFPRKNLRMEYAAGLEPSVEIDYRRAGAVINRKRGTCIVEFTEHSLKQFYLRDVLMHEIGHHFDSPNRSAKTVRKEEGFAEWFATEYGYRLGA